MNESILKGVNHEIPRFNQETEGEWTGPFHFIQGADTQFGMIDQYILKLPTPNWDKEIALTTKAVAAANKMQPKPRFFIVCGDLTHIFPEDDPETKEKQDDDYLKVFSELDPEIPLICVCGNHDIGNQPTVQTVDRYKGKFGDDYFSFWVGGVFSIVLNSQFYEDPSQVAQLAAEQDEWLDNQLATIEQYRPKHSIIFQHIPWLLNTPDEPKEYFNIEPELRSKMLEKFQKAGIKTIFCGHYHRNAGGHYQNMELVVTSAIGAALGNDPSGLRVVKVQESAIEHIYYPLDDIPTEINFE